MDQNVSEIANNDTNTLLNQGTMDRLNSNNRVHNITQIGKQMSSGIISTHKISQIDNQEDFDVEVLSEHLSETDIYANIKQTDNSNPGGGTDSAKYRPISNDMSGNDYSIKMLE